MRILIIEDDPEIGAALSADLGRHYGVDWFQRRQFGAYSAQINEYDAIILDIGLPDGDGIELCQELRSEGLQTPIIILTAHTNTRDVVQALDAGADDYLRKPFRLAELKARLRALLRRPQGHRAATLHFQDIEVDPNRRVVTRGGQIIELGRKQFDLLEFLMRNHSRVISRKMISDYLWDGSNPLSNVIVVHMKYLRDHLDGPFPHKVIHTITGIGYKLE